MDSRSDSPTSGMSRESSTESLLQLIQTDHVTAAAEKLALEQGTKVAVSEVGPRVYKLSGHDQETLQFYVMGCQGNGKDSQKAVAELMDRCAREATAHKPAFVLILGDNIYDYGVDSPLHNGFQDCFHDIYANNSLTALSQLPFFLILGNHDENLHAWANWSNNKSGIETAINEVAHTFLPEGDKFPSIADKTKLYRQENLDLKSIPQWNMPYFYYSIIASDVQIFCIDSNTYPQEFLDLQNGVENPARKNQAAWLRTEVEKARLAGRKTMVTMHHPLYTSGKRAFPSEHDSKHYLTSEQVNELNNKLHGDSEKYFTSSYNALLGQIFRHQGIVFDMVFAAHDHFISYYNNKLSDDTNKLCLITSGGGGGDIQQRSSFIGHPYVPCHLAETGFTKITCPAKNPQKFNIDIYTTSGHHLAYDSDSHLPLRTISADAQTEELRQVVLDVCDEYLSALKQEELSLRKNMQEKPNHSYPIVNFFFHLGFKASQYLTHNKNKTAENGCVQSIIATLNQPVLPDFATVVSELVGKFEQYELKESSNFKTMLAKKMQEKFGFDLSTIHNLSRSSNSLTPLRSC